MVPSRSAVWAPAYSTDSFSEREEGMMTAGARNGGINEAGAAPQFVWDVLGTPRTS